MNNKKTWKTTKRNSTVSKRSNGLEGDPDARADLKDAKKRLKTVKRAMGKVKKGLKRLQKQEKGARKKAEQAQKKLDKLESKIAKSKLEAPFDGLVLELKAKTGKKTKPKDKLFRLQNLGAVELTFKPDEFEDAQKGDSIFVGAGDVAYQGEVVKFKNKRGKIELVVHINDPAGEAGRLDAKDIFLVKSLKKNTWLVPADSIFEADDTSFILRAEDDSAQRVEVNVLAERGKMSVVEP